MNTAKKNQTVVTHPRFQGASNVGEIDREQIIDDINFLSNHPVILEILSHQVAQIKAGFKPLIDELKKMDEGNDSQCDITPMIRTAPGVIMIETYDPDYEDMIRTMERYPKYKEKQVRSHRTIMRAFNVKVDDA